MHGKFFKNAVLIFLIAFLASAACGEHAANVIKKNTSTPAAKEDLSQKTLDDVATAIDDKNWVRAKKILSAILSRYRKNPRYFLAYGCVYVGSEHDAPAATALKRAIHLDKKLCQAHAALGLYYLRANKPDLAAKAFAAAEIKLGSDRVYRYSRAIGYGMIEDWKKAEMVFENLSKVAKDAQPDDVAISAKERLKEIRVFNKNFQPIINQQKKNLVNEQAQKEQLERESEKHHEELIEIEDEKELLQEDYDDAYDLIEDTYEEAKDRIAYEYERNRPSASLADTDPAAYSRGEYSANRIRSEAIRRLKKLRKAAIARLKRKIAPKVRDIKKRISTAKKELESLRRDIKVKNREIRKLELALQKYQAKNQPFDANKYSRDATIWLTRKAILNSAWPPSQPTTQPD